jgi:hypothetical protein
MTITKFNEGFDIVILGVSFYLVALLSKYHQKVQMDRIA